ncbi:MAG: fused MFS/spermidine synthase [Gammaproteobacteria bacterium]|nr:fused MFS/spermidine synthase [Gammaproteobacteria bacterium]
MVRKQNKKRSTMQSGQQAGIGLQPVGRENLRERHLLVALAACFLLSGFAALLYQAAWLKQLGVVFGASHIAVATVLAAYMAGLALGAALAARFVPAVRRPVLVYGALEGLIGIAALLVPVLLGLAQLLFITLFGGQSAPASAAGAGQTLYYLAATFLILALPTAAMGATLPLLAKYAVSADSQIGPRVGFLYGINTLGAVFGALASGFLLLPYLGLFGTLATGAAVNLLVFFVAVWLARLVASAAGAGAGLQPVSGSDAGTAEQEAGSRRPVKSGKQRSAPVAQASAPSQVRYHWIMPVMLVSGMISFTLEVLWTRLLSHLFGGTIYAFSVMLACFLTGIALGGLVAGHSAQERGRARVLFVAAQVLTAAFSWFSYIVMCTWLPQGNSLLSNSLYAFLVIAPATLFIGASYPLAVRIGARTAAQAASVAGRIYTWNTVGAISGALLTGFIILPALGFGHTLQLAMLVSIALAAGVAATMQPQRKWAVSGVVTMAALTLFALPFERPDGLIYAQIPDEKVSDDEYYYGVGRSATILMSDLDGFFHLTSNGLSESAIARRGTAPVNNSQKWLSGLTTLARPEARSMLVIGFGGGVALAGVAPHVTDLDVVELEPKVISANRAVSNERNHDPLADPRLNLVINDARNAIMLSDKRYDVIVSQPSHPWTGGASHLYTREFLALAKSRLHERGVFLQWINARFVDESLLKILAATVTEQFRYVELYQPEREVLFFLGSDSPLQIWDGARNAARALAEHPRHYQRLGLRGVEDALVMLALDDPGVRQFSAGAPVNTDEHNRLAFFSRNNGDGLTADDMQRLFNDMDLLTNPQSVFYRRHADEFNLVYIAERLLMGDFILRAYNMAQAVPGADNKALIAAMGRDNSGDVQGALAQYQQALKFNPDNAAAKYGLLLLYLGDIARGQAPREAIGLANSLQGPQRRVFEAWTYGLRGQFGRIEELDTVLAQVSPTSSIFPLAVKLRVDWRLAQAREHNDAQLARKALDLLDDLLATYWSPDLYILRSGCAYLAGDGYAYVESVWNVIYQLRQRLAQVEQGEGRLPPEEAAQLRQRLTPMLGRLSDPLTEPLALRAQAVSLELQKLLEQLREI